LELLENDALLARGRSVIVGELAVPSWRIHGLLHDAALHLLTHEEIGAQRYEFAAAHAEVVRRYPAAIADLPDDGYIHSHLLWHLERAQQEPRIHELLAEELPEGGNAWFTINDRLGHAGSYRDGLLRAWTLAEKSDSGVALELRYALIVSSIRTLAAKLPPELLGRLVQAKVWGPEQALSFSRQNGMT